MARDHGMIEPFEERQVREGVVSYGLSSFGYDIRVADEFKVFTDVYSVVVDPKHFDTRSFVDIQGEGHCIIPPNSFALARTLEHFNIPPDVLVICLGKSTYARCLRGDTRVALVDGSSPTLEEMAEQWNRGERFWGYALGPLGRIVVAELTAPRYIGRDGLLEIELDDGACIRATPDHEFIRRDGRVASANELRSGDSLMPLYRELIRGYESIYQPLNGHLYPTHRLSDEWNVRHGIYPDTPGTHRHHRDHDRRNNAPWNIERMPAGEHIRHHNSEIFGPGFDAIAHGDAIRFAIARCMQDEKWRQRFKKQQREKAFRFWTNAEYAEARRLLLEKRAELWTGEARARVAERMRARYPDPLERQAQGERMKSAWAADTGERRGRQREAARGLRIRDELTETVVIMALVEAGTIRGAARNLGCDRSVFRRFPRSLEVFRNHRCKNHKVASVRSLRGDHDVYCLTVPEAGNFALSSGIFTRNCGIIVNVTPLEPEWRGHLTLEISNTTPLPAKIYANEGIAQLIFFQSDETPSITYAQRGGKYLDQRGVTPPRM